MLDPPQGGQVDGNDGEAGLEGPGEVVGSIDLCLIRRQAVLLLVCDAEPGSVGAERDESRQEDEEHGKAPLQGGTEHEDVRDGKRDGPDLEEQVGNGGAKGDSAT